MSPKLLGIILMLIIGLVIKFARRGELPDDSDTRLQARILSECASLGDVMSAEVRLCEDKIRAELK